MKNVRLTPSKLTTITQLLEDSDTLAEEVSELILKQRLGLFAIPTDIGVLKCLKWFELNGNPVRALPESMGSLQALEHLSAFNNRISCVPDSICLITGLKELYLSHNKITSLSKCIRELKCLTKLVLSNNFLKALPTEIGNLCKLETLLLSKNFLTALPESIGNLNSLQTLDVDKNLLTIIPEQIGDCTKLKEIYVRRNRLSKLPSRLGNLCNLTLLYVSDNYLVNIPDSFCRLVKLEWVHLRNNKLKTLFENDVTTTIQKFPKVIWPNVKDLDLSYNDFCTLPLFIDGKKMLSLTSLNLEGNELNYLPSTFLHFKKSWNHSAMEINVDENPWFDSNYDTSFCKKQLSNFPTALQVLCAKTVLDNKECLMDCCFLNFCHEPIPITENENDIKIKYTESSNDNDDDDDDHDGCKDLIAVNKVKFGNDNNTNYVIHQKRNSVVSVCQENDCVGVNHSFSLLIDWLCNYKLCFICNAYCFENYSVSFIEIEVIHETRVPIKYNICCQACHYDWWNLKRK